MKCCRACEEIKPLSEFTVYKTGVHGQPIYRGKCKPCLLEHNKAWRKANAKSYSYPEYRKSWCKEHRGSLLAIRHRTVSKPKAYLREYLETHPCVDCGEDDWVVLELDHVRGEKYRNARGNKIHVAALISGGYSLALVKAEIEKCDVRCANCHRRVTYQRQESWRVAGAVTTV